MPFDFDPHRTHLVQAEWEDGIGCPTNSRTAPFLPPTFDTVGAGMFTDTACITGDPRDKRNTGLLLAKTGPTNNNASAGASLNGVRGVSLTELGYDIRKVGDFPVITASGLPSLGFLDSRGSHCGGGAPRFNVVIGGDTYFIACSSPPPTIQVIGNGWLRLRWGGPALPLLAFGPGTCAPCDISGQPVDRISIVFDEGQDTGPDYFGAAVLDNIDVNGTLIGRGPDKPEDKDRDECEGKDKDHRHFHSHSSASRPETSDMSFEDPNNGTKIQMVNGARSVSYSGACMTLIGDALVNEDPGYLVTFAACDLSALSTPLLPKIGTYSVLVTGASGVVYQKSGALTSGFVTIHPR